MIEVTIERELSACLSRMSTTQQRRVLEFAQALASPARHGVRGADLLRFVGAIDDADLEAMSQAIEDGCERVDADEW